MRNKKKPNTHTNCEYKRHTAMECLENIRQVHSLAINHSDCVYACALCVLCRIASIAFQYHKAKSHYGLFRHFQMYSQ